MEKKQKTDDPYNSIPLQSNPIWNLRNAKKDIMRKLNIAKLKHEAE